MPFLESAACYKFSKVSDLVLHHSNVTTEMKTVFLPNLTAPGWSLHLANILN